MEVAVRADVVQMLQQAKAAGTLGSRFEVDALPEAGRAFERQANGSLSAGGGIASGPAVNSPVPDLYRYSGEKNSQSDAARNERAGSRQAAGSDTDEESTEKPRSGKGFFARMFGRSEQ